MRQPARYRFCIYFSILEERTYIFYLCLCFIYGKCRVYGFAKLTVPERRHVGSTNNRAYT
jgi:hypothetical protein